MFSHQTNYECNPNKLLIYVNNARRRCM